MARARVAMQAHYTRKVIDPQSFMTSLCVRGDLSVYVAA
jgi:hypothetical protein